MAGVDWCVRGYVGGWVGRGDAASSAGLQARGSQASSSMVFSVGPRALAQSMLRSCWPPGVIGTGKIGLALIKLLKVRWHAFFCG